MKAIKKTKTITIEIKSPRIIKAIKEEAKIQGITNKSLIMQIIKLSLD